MAASAGNSPTAIKGLQNVKRSNNLISNQRGGRKNKPIYLDQSLLDERIKSYIAQFPEGSLNHMLAQFSPVPTNHRLEDKFEYFYRPYNYTCNVAKYINYEGEGVRGENNPYKLYQEILRENHFIEEFLISCNSHKRSYSEP